MYRVFEIVQDDGRTLTWLAKAIPISRNYLYQIKMGRRNATPWFRARCVEILGKPEDELFAPADVVTVMNDGAA